MIDLKKPLEDFISCKEGNLQFGLTRVGRKSGISGVRVRKGNCWRRGRGWVGYFSSFASFNIISVRTVCWV